MFSEKFACPVSGFTIPEIEPRLFSFNNPFGACPKCGGLGVEQHIDADLVIPDKERTLRQGAIAPWSRSSSPYYMQTLTALGKHYRFTLDTKWKDLPKKTQDAILNGSGDDAIKFTYDDGMRAYETTKPFEGVVTNLERRFRETESDWAREEIARYFTDIPCDACNGYRLKPEALCVKVGGRHIGEVSEMSVKRAGEWFTELPQRLTGKQNEIAGARAQGDPRAAEVPGRRRARISHARARLGHALRRREPAHPARLADRLRPHRRALRARRADHRPAPARQRAAARNAAAPARPRQHRDRGRARRGRDPHRRPRARHRPRRRHPRRPRRGAGHGRRHHGGAELVHRQIPLRRDDGAGARAPPARPAAHAQAHRRARQQPQERHRRNPARPVHLRHRRLRRRQVDAPGRHALQGDRAPPQRRAARPLPRTTASRASNTSTRSSTSTSRRSAARRARIPRPTPARSRRSANGSPACPRRRRAATSPAASRSTSRAAAARPARATASSRSRCTSCPTSTSPATSARASATTARRSR